MKKFLLFLLVGCVLSFNVVAKDYNFPSLTGPVVDAADILDKKAEKRLKDLLSSNKENQIVIATIKNLNGEDGREYGLELARKWQLGEKGKDNGILILLSVEDRYTGIEVGYGLEGLITDSISGRIARNLMFPDFKKKNWEEGLFKGAEGIIKILNGEDAEKIVGPEAGDLALILFLIFLFLIVTVLCAIYDIPLAEILPIIGSSGGFSGGGGSFGGGGFGGKF